MWHGRARAQPHWVRSHRTAEAFAAEFPGQMWRRDLNAKADALAGSRALAACAPHFVRKVRELDQVVREVNCFLASRAEKLIKNKFQEFVPRAVRASLGHFEKPRLLTGRNMATLGRCLRPRGCKLAAHMCNLRHTAPSFTHPDI